MAPAEPQARTETDAFEGERILGVFTGRVGALLAAGEEGTGKAGSGGARDRLRTGSLQVSAYYNREE